MRFIQDSDPSFAAYGKKRFYFRVELNLSSHVVEVERKSLDRYTPFIVCLVEKQDAVKPV